MSAWMFSLRNPKIFLSQTRRHYLTKEGPVLKFFHCLIWIKEPCVRKFEGLARSKILGISQTLFIEAAENVDSRFFEERYLYKRSNQHFSTLDPKTKSYAGREGEPYKMQGSDFFICHQQSL